jgi:autophagy-related protein 16
VFRSAAYFFPLFLFFVFSSDVASADNRLFQTFFLPIRSASDRSHIYKSDKSNFCQVMAAKFFIDSNRVVSGSHDRTLKIWDLRSKACIGTKYPGSSCNDVVTAELTVISAHFDKKVRFWDTRSNATEPTHEVLLGGKVASLDMTPGRHLLAIGSRDDRLKVLDLRMNTVVGNYSAEGYHVGCDWSRVSFSPDGEFLAAGGGEQIVFISFIVVRVLCSTGLLPYKLISAVLHLARAQKFL